MTGLLGLIGVAGVLDPGLFRLSALSALSFLSFFRFFRCFIDADYWPHRELARLIAMAVMAVGVGVLVPLLVSISPIFGFLGFAGTLGLYDPPRSADHLTAA
jgi:hypothetical protein